MGKLRGKVALITGAARGQGRSHAVRLAGSVERGRASVARYALRDGYPAGRMSVSWCAG